MLENFLEFLGSRIVFLIDWNRARKALQIFMGKTAAVELLTWAAANDFAGIAPSSSLAAPIWCSMRCITPPPGRIRYGARLGTALGVADCVEFLRHVLRDTSQGLAAGRSVAADPR